MTYKIYNYKKDKCNFFRIFNEYLIDNLNNKKVKSIDEVVNFYSYKDQSKIETIFYRLFHTKEFINIYKKFVKINLKSIFKSNFECQNIPSVRIAFPGEKSVNFHNDCWYGHNKNIMNVWIPITNVKKTQSLAFLNSQDNEKALKYFYQTQPSIKTINKYCFKKSNFAELNYGQFLIFPTRSLHGTVKNLSSEIRISFDFRICFDGKYGLKNKNFFSNFFNTPRESKLINSRKKNIFAIGYINQKKIFNKMILSQTIQQETIVSYCKKNNLDLLKLETELIGFTKPINLENILFGNEKKNIRNIIIFSEKNLDLKNKENSKLIHKAIAKGYIFHFINEGTILKKIYKY